MRSPGFTAALVIGTLATWRVSRMLVHEDGPADLLVKVRGAVEGTPLAGVLDCFACSSVWVGCGVGAVSFAGRLPLGHVAVAGLALSGGAMLIEFAVQGSSGPAEHLPEPQIDSPLVTVQTG